MRLKITLDRETTGRLVEAAVRESRPVGFQAEVLIRRALGMPDRVYTPDTAPTREPAGGKGVRGE